MLTSYMSYVSPLKWGEVLFLAPLSVCLYVRPSVRASDRPPVRPSRFRVLSIFFEPLVGFTNNFAQMSSMMYDIAHGVFITFCDSSSLRFHLPLQKNLIPSSDIWGET